VAVLDGDTIEVLHNTHPERVRLSGIDCPEKGQAYGQKAKQAALALVFGKEVTLQAHGKDKYGRTLADVFLPDGTTELTERELIFHIHDKQDGPEQRCWMKRLGVPYSAFYEQLQFSQNTEPGYSWRSNHLTPF
jgi:hypothetical protein